MEDKSVIILGAKGIGKVALDILESNGFVVYCFLDDDASLHSTEIANVAVLGKTDDDGFLKFIGKKCDAFVALEDATVRKKTVENLHDRRKVQPVNAVHKGANVSENAAIGYGNFVNVGASINAGAKMGSHCVVHANALIDFDAEVGDFVQIGAGAVINSGVKIEEGAFIGTGVVIVSGVTIGENARVGAGSVVIKDVKAKETVFGNPAEKVS